jgi:DNA-binding transcriptional regulator LsrR (DeoR family)
VPYLSEKIKIEKTQYDKRVKLTDNDKDLIRTLYATGDHSQRSLAAQFSVSRRTITFAIDPAKREANYQVRVARGGSRQYYDKEKHTDAIRVHRRYKQQLVLDGKVDIPLES